jgi:hypothetical protein
LNSITASSAIAVARLCRNTISARPATSFVNWFFSGANFVEAAQYLCNAHFDQDWRPQIRFDRAA